MRPVLKAFVLLFVVVFSIPAAAAQNPDHFYNVDTELRIKGEVVDVVFEPRYKDRAKFLILVIKENSSEKDYRVEVGPAWFFDQDLHKGESVEVIGSLVTDAGNEPTLIARQIGFRGETVVIRDGRGFPEWRGAKSSMRRGRRKGGGS
jgi:hypothetical protein